MSDLLTRDEAAALLGVPWTTLRNWTYHPRQKKHDLPRPLIIVTGGKAKVHWRRDELVAWSANRGR